MRSFLLVTYLFFSIILWDACFAANTQKQVIIGYVGGYRGRLINTDAIPVYKFTHINYAFANVKNNRVVLSRERTDTVNLKSLSQLKKKNPALKILISIGGWSWSGNFSDAVLTDTARQTFAESAVALLSRFDLDGIDIDWEYPGMNGNNQKFRKEDKHNYTLMFIELRRQLDMKAKKSGKKLLLTTATGGFKDFLRHTEMDQTYPYLDYINLMTYDYFGNGAAVHHTNLYTSAENPNYDSADKAVTDYLAAGVPASKLVMGIAFYGRSFQLKTSALKGLGDGTSSHIGLVDYVFIKDSLINKKGYIKYQDEKAKAPYLFNTTSKQFITYEDEWSVESKCNYVLAHKLAGVMFWEYDADPKDYLLDEINLVLK
jgi:chitinase